MIVHREPTRSLEQELRWRLRTAGSEHEARAHRDCLERFLLDHDDMAVHNHLTRCRKQGYFSRDDEPELPSAPYRFPDSPSRFAKGEITSMRKRQS